MSDSGERTEQPTQRRLQKAREEGNVLVSRELIGTVHLLSFASLLAIYGGDLVRFIQLLMQRLLVAAVRGQATPRESLEQTIQFLWHSLPSIAPALTVLIVLPIAVQIAIARGALATGKLKADWSRLNPFPRLKQMPAQNFGAVKQSVLLLVIFGVIVWWTLDDATAFLLTGPHRPLRALAESAAGYLKHLLFVMAGVLMVAGAADYVRQHKQFWTSLRMTRREIRDEQMESEGSPQIKARMRRMQREMRRKNRIKNVDQATAVIVNPTHFAVAIRYQPEAMAAPRVIAKGRNYVALRMRQRAENLAIPIVENKPLAQALYFSVEVGQEIPPHLYKAIAEILAYVYRLANGRLRG